MGGWVLLAPTISHPRLTSQASGRMVLFWAHLQGGRERERGGGREGEKGGGGRARGGEGEREREKGGGREGGRGREREGEGGRGREREREGGRGEGGRGREREGEGEGGREGGREGRGREREREGEGGRQGGRGEGDRKEGGSPSHNSAQEFRSMPWFTSRFECRNLLLLPGIVCADVRLGGVGRHATSVWQGNWFSVAIRPVPKATQYYPPHLHHQNSVGTCRVRRVAE